MKLSVSALLSQYKRDAEFRSSIICFGYSVFISLIAAWFPFNIHFSLFATVLAATFILSPPLGFRPIFTVQSSFLGWVVGASISFTIVFRSTLIPIFCLYVFVMAVFHFSEFFFTAITNRRSLQADSFLLNHSHAYWIAAIVSWTEFVIESYLVPSSKMPWLSLLGLLTCFCGEFIRKTAMVQAGVGFTHKLALSKRPDHRLVTTGIYSYLRHPGYTGWLIWSVGTQIVLCNPICFFAYAIVSWQFFNERIYDEERDLIQFFGDEYLAYQKKVWIGVPFVKGCDL